MTLTTTEAALLGLLRRRQLSGYDLRKEVERSVAYFWGPAKTQIYRALPRLVETGLATRRTVVQSDRPDKHLYAITDEGREALRRWIEQAPLDAGQGRNLLLLKLSIADPESAEALLAQVRERAAEAERLRDELERLEADAGPVDPTFQRFTRRWGLLYVDALLRWTEEVARELERVTSATPTQR